MRVSLLWAAARTTETNNGRYWWVWVIVVLVVIAMGAKFYVDRIKKR